MLKRKAFLVGSPEMPTVCEGPLVGVTPDINNMMVHLLSSHGGAWRSDEIAVFESPRTNDLFSALEEEVYDFVIFQYSGHGFSRSGKETLLHIHPKENAVSIREINKRIKSSKRYCFLDCCRGIEDKKGISMCQRIIESCGDWFQLEDPYNKSRKKYDDIVNGCDNGTSIIYSCSINQESKDIPDGGIFSYCYFDEAKRIGILRDDAYYTISGILNMAKQKMKDNGLLHEQTPVIELGNGNCDYPFVV